MANEFTNTKVEDSAKNDRLLDEFEPSTYGEWRKAAEESLKGVPFEKKLLTKTYEGITLQPIYNSSDIKELQHMGGLPGFAPFVRGTGVLGRSTNTWEVCQEIRCVTPRDLNSALVHDLERGQTAINLVLDRAGQMGKDPDRAGVGEVCSSGVSVISVTDVSRIFQNIDIERFPVYLDAGFSGLSAAALLVASLKNQCKNPSVLQGCIENDPLGMLARNGVLPRPLSNIYNEISILTNWAVTHAPRLKTMLVSGCPYHDAGGSLVEELSFVLATGVEYLREAIDRGLNVDDAALRMRFSFSVGGDLFMEVAKLRAARLVWAQAVKAFGGGDTSQMMAMHVRTSAWNKTVYDPYVNMLRCTTETFSAVIAGADSVHTSPFDEPVRSPDEFSRRIARNVQIILNEESHLSQVADPAGGSWYVEHLTNSIASKAWSLFQEVEKKGGMAKALAAGFPQQLVAQTAEAKAKDIATGKAVVLGTNLYPNKDEQPLEQKRENLGDLHATRAVHAARFRLSGEGGCRGDVLRKLKELSKASAGEVFEAAIAAAVAEATLGEIYEAVVPEGCRTVEVEPLRIERAAKMYEDLREKVTEYEEETGEKPKVFLATMGPIPQHKARADFATGFFEVGGFDVLGNTGFPTPEEAAKAAINSGAKLVVICSSDDTYPQIVPRFTKELGQHKAGMTVILAGYPKNQVEAHRSAGVDEFIHLKTNNYETLRSLLEKIGVGL